MIVVYARGKVTEITLTHSGETVFTCLADGYYALLDAAIIYVGY